MRLRQTYADIHKHTSRDTREIYVDIQIEIHTAINNEVLIDIHINTHLDIDIVIHIDMQSEIHDTWRYTQRLILR